MVDSTVHMGVYYIYYISITGYPDRLCKSQKSRHVVLSRARRQAGLSSRLLKWVPTIHCVDIDRRDILLSREQTEYEPIVSFSRSLIDTLITGIFQSFMYKLNMLCQSSSRFVAFTTNNQSPWTWGREMSRSPPPVQTTVFLSALNSCSGSRYE